MQRRRVEDKYYNPAQYTLGYDGLTEISNLGQTDSHSTVCLLAIIILGLSKLLK